MRVVLHGSSLQEAQFILINGSKNDVYKFYKPRKCVSLAKRL